MRYTRKNLDEACAILNKESGSPLDYVAGHFYIGSAYGSYRLERLSDGGGSRDISERGTARDIHTFISAMLVGIDLGKDSSKFGKCPNMAIWKRSLRRERSNV